MVHEILRTMRACSVNYTNHQHTYNALCSAKDTSTKSECRCVRRAEIEEAPDDGKWDTLALPMFRQ